MALQARLAMTYGYVRVSTSEQGDSGLGVAAQRRALTDAGVEPDVWVEDIGVSGAVAPAVRPGAAELLGVIRRGDTLAVSKLDRLGRDTLDVLALAKLAGDEGWRLVILDLGLDTATPVGKFSLTVLAAVAQLERDLIAERTRDALAALRRRGVRTGRPPSLSEPVRRRIAEELQSGSTLQAVADGLNRDEIATARGGATWRPSSVAAVRDSLALDAELAAARASALGSQEACQPSGATRQP